MGAVRLIDPVTTDPKGEARHAARGSQLVWACNTPALVNTKWTPTGSRPNVKAVATTRVATNVRFPTGARRGEGIVCAPGNGGSTRSSDLHEWRNDLDAVSTRSSVKLQSR